MAYHNPSTIFDVHSEQALPANILYFSSHPPSLYNGSTPGSTLHHNSSCYICYTYMTHVMISTLHSSSQGSPASASTFPVLAMQQRGIEFQHGFREGFNIAKQAGVHARSESFSGDNSQGDELQLKKENHTTELLEQARAEIDRLQNQLAALEETYYKLLPQVTSHARGDIKEPMCESDSRVALPDRVNEEQDLLIDTSNDSDSDSDESFHYIGESTTVDFGEGTEWSDAQKGGEGSFDLKLLAGGTVTKASDQAPSITFKPCLEPGQEGSGLILGPACHDEGIVEGALQPLDSLPPSSSTQSDLRSYSIEKIRELMDRAHRVGGEEAKTQVKLLVSRAHATPQALRTEVHTVLLNEWRRPQVQASTLLTNVPSSTSSSQEYVYVDASDVGIGFVFDNKWEAWRLRNGWRQGGWKQGKLRDIQWAEAVAVELGVRVMIKAGYAGEAITLCSDNTQVVQAFEQGRPIGEPLAQEVLSNTERLCRLRKIRLRVMWIPGARNPADGPSRLNVGSAKTRFPYHAEIPPYLQDIVSPFYQ